MVGQIFDSFNRLQSTLEEEELDTDPELLIPNCDTCVRDVMMVVL